MVVKHHPHTPVRLLGSRTLFRSRIVELQLLLASLSPRPSELFHEATAADGNATTAVEGETLSFARLKSGLPFDFSMRPGQLPPPLASGRRLREASSWAVRRGVPWWQAWEAPPPPLASSALALRDAWDEYGGVPERRVGRQLGEQARSQPPARRASVVPPAKPAAKQAANPAPRPAPKPVAKPVPRYVAKPAPRPAAKPAPVAKPIPAAKPAPRPVAKAVARPVAKAPRRAPRAPPPPIPPPTLPPAHPIRRRARAQRAAAAARMAASNRTMAAAGEAPARAGGLALHDKHIHFRHREHSSSRGPQLPRPASLTSSAAAAGATSASGGGSDDFFFTFAGVSIAGIGAVPSAYDVYAFGFELLEYAPTGNETLSVYDPQRRLIGRLPLRREGGGGAVAGGAGAGAGMGGGSAAVPLFVGVVSEAAVGFVSLDIDAGAVNGYEVSVADFVFGYRENDALARPYPPQAWLLLGGAMLLACVVEWRVLRRLPRSGVSVSAALLWLAAWGVVGALGGGCVWAARSREHAAMYGVLALLNCMLSSDNLFVFMVLLQQAGVRAEHQPKALCFGMLLAILGRTLLLLAGAALLERFWWLKFACAALLLFLGAKMLLYPEATPDAEHDDAFDPSDYLAVRCVGRCVPLLWSDATGGAFVARDERGRWCVARMLVMVVAIGSSDMIFALDSVPVMLSLTHNTFLLVLASAASMLGLRPLYFLLSALAGLMDSLQRMLAVVLILIGSRTFAEAAGLPIPLVGFVATLLVWRIAFMLYALWATSRGDAEGKGKGKAAEDGSKTGALCGCGGSSCSLASSVGESS